MGFNKAESHPDLDLCIYGTKETEFSDSVWMGSRLWGQHTKHREKEGIFPSASEPNKVTARYACPRNLHGRIMDKEKKSPFRVPP